MTCWQCGASLPPDAGFCRSCGAILRGRAAAHASPSTTPTGTLPGPVGAAQSPTTSTTAYDPAGRPAAVGGAFETASGAPPASPATATAATAGGVKAADLVALVGSIVVSISLFMSWYTITISAAGMQDVERLVQGVASSLFGHSLPAVGLGSGPQSAGLAALDHNAGGWRWAILVVAVITAVELLLTLLAASSSPREPGWPHAPLLLVFAVTDFVLLVVAFFDGPLNGVPSSIATSSHAFGAYLGVIAGLVVLGAAIARVASSQPA